jgi:acyl-CoA reductase-like NAD-dependent aldehyde dehydrogenase
MTFPVCSPATGERVELAVSSTLEDLDNAVSRATDAFALWSARTAYDREIVIRRATTFARTQADRIGLLMAREQGKPLAQSISEILGSCDTLDYFAAEGPRIEGFSNPTEAANLRSWVTYSPVGVCGLLTPWNYPVSLLAWKLGPMLGAGCTGVVKPSPVCPLSPAAFCAALTEGGLPAGVIEVVTGPSASLGEAVVAHTGIKKVAMTGSTSTGKAIFAACAKDLKKVSLELGGQCPAIVCADADLDLTAKLLCYKGFRNMGQSCSGVNRVYAHRSIADRLIEKTCEIASKMTIGDGVTDPKVDLGPMATAEALARVEAHVDDAVSRGATVMFGGRRPEGFPTGNFYLPTVLTGMTPSMRVAQEETFGPVLPFASFDDLEEAISLANATPYGLAAYLFARDFATVIRVSERLEAGTVCVNNVAVNTNYGPYEGWGDSGFGVELGRRSIFEYLRTKHTKVAL